MTRRVPAGPGGGCRWPGRSPAGAPLTRTVPGGDGGGGGGSQGPFPSPQWGGTQSLFEGEGGGDLPFAADASGGEHGQRSAASTSGVSTVVAISPVWPPAS